MDLKSGLLVFSQIPQKLLFPPFDRLRILELTDCNKDDFRRTASQYAPFLEPRITTLGLTSFRNSGVR